MLFEAKPWTKGSDATSTTTSTTGLHDDAAGGGGTGRYWHDRALTALAQFRYSERLLLMDGLTTCFEPPVPPFTAAELNLPPRGGADGDARPSKRAFLVHLNPELDAVLPPDTDTDTVTVAPTPGKAVADPSTFTLYGIPQTLYKLNADFDPLIRGILESDPNGYIVLPSGVEGALPEAVVDRLRRALGATEAAMGGRPDGNSDTAEAAPAAAAALLRRVVFVRHMAEREYLTFCAVLDVVLDPFPVGGGRSSLEIFSTGTPVVLLYPRTSILQLTAAMYAVMGIGGGGGGGACCIAFDPVDFVRKAVAVGADPVAQRALREEILRHNHRLYGNATVVREWEKMLRYGVGEGGFVCSWC